MSRRSCTILTAALLCAAYPALGQQLPDGPGRELAQANCNICHALLSRVGAGYTPEGWNTVLQMMINQGAPLPADQIEPLKAYLIRSFQEKGKAAGAVMPGPAKISFREWQAPTPGSRPHDPLAASDGSLWYTGQLANVLGRVDPNSGEIKLLTPPTANARPYGMALNSKGIVFFVEFGTNQVGSVDPKTLEFHEYKLPDPASRPRRIAITSDDIVWYSDYSRGYLGRLDSTTGKVTEWPSPSGPKSEPYGISAISDVIWYSESGSTPNTVVRFDPKTEKFQSWAIPGGGNIVRNTSVTRDGNFLLANSLMNDITLVTIKRE